MSSANLRIPPLLTTAAARERAASDGAEPGVEELLSAVRTIAPILQAGAVQSDEQGYLAPESVAALRDHGLWRMRLCLVAGGLELPIVAQMRVIAALAAADASSAWCTMVANHGVAVMGATMPQAAFNLVFAHGVPACSIVPTPGGAAKPVDGGYSITGTWRLASGIHHAEWVHAAALVERDPSRLLPLAIPAGDVELLDTWRVIGLGGTGSNDFKLTDYFLPAALAGNEKNPHSQFRGVRRYDRVALEHVESYEHTAFAIGITRRALHELRLALGTRAGGRNHGDREIVQEEFGRSVLRLQTIEALAYAFFAKVDDAVLDGDQAWSQGERYLPRVLAAQATELALECVQLAFRRSGLVALHRPNILEKLLRDMSVAATHAVVDDAAFASYAQYLVETGQSFETRFFEPRSARA